jgi:ABC-type dipeptide/oligopeptide/nickel transport system ATPase subunit
MSDVAAVAFRDVSRAYSKRGTVRTALATVSFETLRGTTTAIVGESGAGKSTLARIVCGLEPPTSGTVLIGGEPPRLTSGAPSRAQMVFQNPGEALDPTWPITRSVAEPLKRLSRRDRAARALDLLRQVGISPARGGDRPASFSGGQLQRIVIARALAAEPAVLVCDEPTSALDVSVQAQIINLLLALQAQSRFACLLITHDLGVARRMADNVLVLKDGRAVEHSSASAFFAEPTDSYSRLLLEAARRQELVRPTSRYPGSVPSRSQHAAGRGPT